MRRLLRSALVGVIVGTVGLGSAWAVIGTTTPPLAPVADSAASAGGADTTTSADAALNSIDLPSVAALDGKRLPEGQFLAGAAKVSIAPRADKWLPNENGVCGQDTGTYAQAATRKKVGEKECLATFDHRWATKVDPLGIWARATAIGNGEKTVIFATLDTVGWFAGYPAEHCATCGADAIRAKVATITGVNADNIVISSSHTHAAPDTLSQTPTWYYEQVRDAATKAMAEAVAALEPVVLETGAAPAKAYNVDRRIITRAVPDYELGWLRAFRPGPGRSGRGETVAVITNFAVHPTVRADNAELHSGFVGPLTRDIESDLGGQAMWFAGGLGDQTVDRGFGTEGIGGGLADVVLEDITHGYRLQDNTIQAVRSPVSIPGENTFMLAGRGAGLFIRDLLPPYSSPGGPVNAKKGGTNGPSCSTVSTLNVESSVTGIRFGRVGITGPEGRGDRGDGLTIITAPGEIFASIALTTKDMLSKTRNVLVFGMTNDTVGYLIPYEQYDERGAQGAGFANLQTDLGNYEEALSLSRCAGDVVQNTMLDVGTTLGVMGAGEGR